MVYHVCVYTPFFSYSRRPVRPEAETGNRSRGNGWLRLRAITKRGARLGFPFPRSPTLLLLHLHLLPERSSLSFSIHTHTYVRTPELGCLCHRRKQSVCVLGLPYVNGDSPSNQKRKAKEEEDEEGGPLEENRMLGSALKDEDHLNLI